MTETLYDDADDIPADADIIGVQITRDDLDTPESRRLEFADITPADDKAATRWLGVGVTSAVQLLSSGGPLAVAFTWWLAGRKAGMTEQPRRIQQSITHGTLDSWQVEMIAVVPEADPGDDEGPPA